MAKTSRAGGALCEHREHCECLDTLRPTFGRVAKRATMQVPWVSRRNLLIDSGPTPLFRRNFRTISQSFCRFLQRCQPTRSRISHRI